MADPKLNNKGFSEPDAEVKGTFSRESSRSPLAAREGNAEPLHSDGGGSLGMDEPSAKDTQDAWQHQGERYANKYF